MNNTMEMIKKHNFWILCGVMMIASLVTWMLATGALDKEFATRATEIDSKLIAAETIANTVDHPNAKYQAGMDVLLAEYRLDIKQAWQEKWNKQQQDLVWPKELNVQGSSFTDQINALLLGRPIEALDEKRTLGKYYRERYRDYIKEELPKLAGIIGSKWTAKKASGGGGSDYGFDTESCGGYGDCGGESGGYGDPGVGNPLIPKEKPPLVQWDTANQSQILGSFDWSSSANQTPTTKELLYAQEDLWVLNALMKIIAKTNGNIEEPHQAAIKQIKSIQFGRDVARINSKVMTALGASSTPGGYGDEYGDDGCESAGYDEGCGSDGCGGCGGYDMGEGGGCGGYDMGEGGEEGGYGTATTSTDPANYRYVDKDYKKLSAADLKTDMTAPSADKYYLAVAKRLPVRLNLIIDERKLDKLLIECSNSDLMVEVRQVRVNTSATSGGSLGGYGGGGGDYGGDCGGYGGGGCDSYGDDSGGYGGGECGVYGGGGTSQKVVDDTHFDVPVEVYGIIYIYNPVNRELLEGGGPSSSVSEETSDDPAAETE